MCTVPQVNQCKYYYGFYTDVKYNCTTTFNFTFSAISKWFIITPSSFNYESGITFSVRYFSNKFSYLYKIIQFAFKSW